MIRCIAIDDEPLALDIIERYVGKIPDLQLAGRFTSALKALDSLNKNDVDLLFLDIQMPEISGIQFLKSLKKAPLVVFTTAYENYALESYDLDVVDYLLKPIPFERFVKAVGKAQEIYSSQISKLSQSEQARDFIFVRSEYQMVKINFDEVLYIEGLKDYVKIFCGPKPIFSHQNLKSIESKLPLSQFIRIHKSYIVPIRKIESVQKSAVRIGGQEIPVGDMYKDQLFRIVNEGS
ncbi:MAG TPA: LytTR family DNA-binding domain-containing protein [Cytophagaceae bacterium]|nr:LytTR family DNA-binding domain-containing protein [Cytophagaceae bacterium]